MQRVALWRAVWMGALTVAFAGTALAADAADSAAPGPCCPKVKGRHAPVARRTLGGGTVRVGPKYVCKPARPLQISIAGRTHEARAIEAAGSLLVPAQALSLLGTVEMEGERGIAITSGARKLSMTLGSPAVRATVGDAIQEQSWPLCPRMLDSVAWVPLRAAAEALGFAVGWRDGAVTLSVPGEAPSVGAATPPPGAEGKCPADRVDEALGTKVLRSPADSPFGAGTQVLELADKSPLKALGVQAKDIIIEWNGQRIKCPMDLDSQLSRERAAGEGVQRIVVVRGPAKLTLAPPTE